MKRRNRATAGGTAVRAALVALAAGLALPAASVMAQPVSPMFTYQGELRQNGALYNGSIDVEVWIFDVPAGGVGVGPNRAAGVGVTDGRFTIDTWLETHMTLDGNEKYLEFRVKPAGSGGPYVTLTPRQRLAPTPYARYGLYAADSDKLDGQDSAFFRDATNLNAGTLSDTRLSTNVPKLNANNAFTGANTFNNAGNSYSGVGTNLTALDASRITLNTLSDTRLTTNVALLNRAGQNWAGTNFFNGNVGFTSISANFPLDVGTNSASSIVASFGSASTQGAGMRVLGGNEWRIVSTGAAAAEGNNKLLFRNQTGGRTTMTLLDGPNGGSLGVNMTAPQAIMHLFGQGAATNILCVDANSSFGSRIQLRNQDPSGADFEIMTSGSALGVPSGTLSIARTSQVGTGISLSNTNMVGIGHASPTAGLHVSRSETTSNGTAAALAITNSATGGTTWTLRSGANGTSTPSGGFSIADGVAYRLSITSAGNVGIGQNLFAPSERLSVDNGINVDANGANNGTLSPGVRFGISSGEGIASKRTPGGNQFGLDFYAGGGVKMALTGAGRLSVGQALPDPNRTMTVKADATTSDWLALSNTAGVTKWHFNHLGGGFNLTETDVADGRIYVAPGGAVGMGTTAPEGRLHVFNGSAGTVTADASSVEVLESSGNAYLSILTGASNRDRGILFGDPTNNADGGIIYNTDLLGADRMRFRTNGNVTRMTLNGSGNLGIGVDTPLRPLSFPDTLGDKIALWGQGTDHYGMGIAANELRMYSPGGGTAIVFGTGNSTDARFLEAMRIQDYKVSIGTFSQDQELNVNGGVTVDTESSNTGIVASNSLKFGAGSGEGMASKRSAGGNQYGLDFFTGFNRRVSITNGGALQVLDPGNQSLLVEMRRADGSGGQDGAIYVHNGVGTNAVSVWSEPGTGKGRIHATGLVQVGALEIMGGGDLAEKFDVSGESVKPGMLVSIDPDHPGKLMPAGRAYDKRVAGVIAGANGVHTGMIMRQEGSVADGEHAVAMTGRVWCYADAGEREIQAGDRLTTSATPGYAMGVDDESRAPGAVIGKAMTPLAKGERGMVLVLVNLQ